MLESFKGKQTGVSLDSRLARIHKLKYPAIKFIGNKKLGKGMYAIQ